VAVGEYFGLPKGKSAMGRIVNALHKMGFEEVYDTTFSADLTIMEETAEFLKRVETGGTLPLLTSCCPAWVKLVTDQYPEFVPNVSTCRSPQGMMSAVIKEYFRNPENAKGKKTVMVSIMPCTAKKAEAIRPNSRTKGEQDTDIVITTTELVRMIKEYGLDLSDLEAESCDMPFGFGSGGGVIFGVTGGVTEAVLRRLSPDHTKEALQTIAESGVRGSEGIKEFTVPYNGIDVKICVVSGLANARKVLERVKSGEAEYHLIEVMACSQGCVMGGGQPIRIKDERTKAERTKGIYSADSATTLKKSDENPLIQELYKGLLKGKEHELLHNEFY
jgi:NADH-quinone oxidoreductase subunit G